MTDLSESIHTLTTTPLNSTPLIPVGVYFSWKQDKETETSGLIFDTKRHVCVIAQDVQKVLPEIVHELSSSSTSSKKYLGVNYVEMVPLLLEAIRELDIRTSSMIIIPPPTSPVSTSSSTSSSSSSSSPHRKRRKLAVSSVDQSINDHSDSTTIDTDEIGKNTDSRRKDDSRIDTPDLADHQSFGEHRQENTTLTSITPALSELEQSKTTTTTISEAEKEDVDMNCGDLQSIIQSLRRRVVAIERDSNILRRRLTAISPPITLR